MDTAPQKIIIAVDPGKSGGIAVQNADGSIQCWRMPKTESAQLEMFSRFKRSEQTVTVWLEEVGGYVSGRPAPGSAMFNFGHCCGFLRGAIMACGHRLELVRPQKWQAPLGLGGAKSCATSADWKRKLKEKAAQLFPDQPVTLATADALLILDYAIRNGHAPTLPDSAR
jgi:hypothetical protein